MSAERKNELSRASIIWSSFRTIFDHSLGIMQNRYTQDDAVNFSRVGILIFRTHKPLKIEA